MSIINTMQDPCYHQCLRCGTLYNCEKSGVGICRVPFYNNGKCSLCTNAGTIT